MNARRTVLTLSLLTGSVALVTACTGDANSSAMKGMTLSRSDSARRLGPGDVKIVSRDTAVQVSLIGDTVFIGLSDRVTSEVAKNLDTGKKESGLGGAIASMVKTAVAGAMKTQGAFPVSSISDARYENGQIVLIGADGKRMSMSSGAHGSMSSDSSGFAPADGEKLVNAIKARKSTAKD